MTSVRSVAFFLEQMQLTRPIEIWYNPPMFDLSTIFDRPRAPCGLFFDSELENDEKVKVNTSRFTLAWNAGYKVWRDCS